VWALPDFIRRWWFEWVALLGLAGYASVVRNGWKRGVVERLDAVSSRCLAVGLPVALVVLCGVLLAGWAPHYLTWPWCRDVDTFATIAQGWLAGEAPYRDVRGYNFPGHIYLHLLLGTVFGWGRPRVFYGADLALLIAMGVLLCAWSRRCLGGALAGLVGYVGVLWHYLGLEFEQVAERDWHTVCLAVGSIAVVRAWHAPWGWCVSAGLLAIGFATRPHAVLFLPAALCAVRGWRARGVWLAVFAGMVALGFLPVVLSGAWPAFLRGLSVAAYGGAYGRSSGVAAWEVFWEELRDPRTPAIVALLAAVAWRSNVRCEARVWLMSVVGAIVYRPIHPVQHAYLKAPLDVMLAVALAVLVGWAAGCARLAGWPRLVMVLVLLHQVLPGMPRLWDPGESRAAIGPLLRGEPVPRPPLGSLGYFHRLPPGVIDRPYEWRAYNDVMDYLRRETRPTTRVANILRRAAFPGLNGTTGRLSPFRAESGICWMWLVEIDLDSEFARALEECTDCVVVWVPDEERVEPRMQLPQVVAVIHRLYEPVARFDNIEVWRRRTTAGELNETKRTATTCMRR
jgi:hypothetical protein